MDLQQIKQILDLVREHDLSEFEIEHEGLRLKIRKDATGAHLVTHAAPVIPAAPPPAAAPPQPAAAMAAPVAADADETEIELAVVKSPIVGTFYRSSEPGSPAFVEVGSSVKKGDVLCIIEAMKLMNEIECDCDGEVATVYVQNSQAVQFGDRLFAVRVS